MLKQAIILAGGRGTRLRPYTTVLPKPLMPIGPFPIIEVIVRQLVYFGFKKITMAVNYQADLIKAFFGDGERWNVSIDYSLELKPLGTIGPLHLVSNLPEHFLVMNGDILTDLNYADFYEDHISHNSLFTISSYCRQQVIDYGVLEVDERLTLVGFREKPKVDYEVSMGVYMASRHILDFVPEDQSYGFDQLMLDLIEAGKKIRVKKFDGYWLDIGRPDDYIKAIEEFDLLKTRFIHD
ncbi:MAG: sugar phosphate nucleotidyltransferase [Candidatus Contendobacter sp.]